MVIASQSGISVCRVTKPSKKPAIIKNGMVLIIIFNPSFILLLKDSNREYVLGNNNPLPKTKPAQPAITITDISMVP